MTNIIPVNLAVEDLLSEAVLRGMLKQSGRPYAVGACFSSRGFGYLKKKLEGFNHASKGTPFLVLTDLDQSECAPILIKEWLPYPQEKNLLFRVAVKAVEAWVLADRQAAAGFLSVPETQIPLTPDEIDNPKRFLINLAAKSRKKEVRESIVPPVKSSAAIGPDYNGKLTEFVQGSWRVKEAMKNSPSLKKAFQAILSFSPMYPKDR
jgi:hypothetical protein